MGNSLDTVLRDVILLSPHFLQLTRPKNQSETIKEGNYQKYGVVEVERCSKTKTKTFDCRPKTDASCIFMILYLKYEYISRTFLVMNLWFNQEIMIWFFFLLKWERDDRVQVLFVKPSFGQGYVQWRDFEFLVGIEIWFKILDELFKFL